MEPRIKYWRPKIARQLHEEMVNDCCFKGVGGKDMAIGDPDYTEGMVINRKDSDVVQERCQRLTELILEQNGRILEMNERLMGLLSTSAYTVKSNLGG